MTRPSRLCPQDIERAVMRVCDTIETENQAATRWNDLSEDELWVELVSCILGSRVRFETAAACSTLLSQRGLINPGTLIEKPAEATTRIADELSRPLYPPFSGKRGSRYPFPASKASFIVKTASEIYDRNGTTIKEILAKDTNPLKVRMTLVKICCGIGLKQASLFLRNISFCDNLAILDVHVIRFLEVAVLGQGLKLTTKRYLIYENILFQYATSRNVSLATLDFAIWIVMRVIHREFGKCR